MKKITVDSPISTLYPIADWLIKHGVTVSQINTLGIQKRFCKHFNVEFDELDEILVALYFLMEGQCYEK